MANNNDFTSKIYQLKDKIRLLSGAEDSDTIEKTATRLEGLNYAPALILPVSTFLRLTRATLLAEIDRIIAMPDQDACALAPDDPQKCQDLRLQFISALVFYYKQLDLLRQGDPDSWDEIDEVYVHD